MLPIVDQQQKGFDLLFHLFNRVNHPHFDKADAKEARLAITEDVNNFFADYSGILNQQYFIHDYKRLIVDKFIKQTYGIY